MKKEKKEQIDTVVYVYWFSHVFLIVFFIADRDGGVWILSCIDEL